MAFWQTGSWKSPTVLTAHRTTIHSVHYFPNGKRMATGAGHVEAIKLWDLETLQEVLTLSAEGSQAFRKIRMSPNGNTLAAVSWDLEEHRLHVWHAPSFEEIHQAETAEE